MRPNSFGLCTSQSWKKKMSVKPPIAASTMPTSIHRSFQMRCHSGLSPKAGRCRSCRFAGQIRRRPDQVFRRRWCLSDDNRLRRLLQVFLGRQVAHVEDQERLFERTRRAAPAASAAKAAPGRIWSQAVARTARFP